MEALMTTENTEQGIAEAAEVTTPPEPAQEQTQEAVQETEAAPAPAKSAREEELERQLSEAEQRYKSAEGRLKARETSPTLQSELSDIKEEIKRDRRERRRRDVAEADLEPVERQQALRQIDAEERQDIETNRLVAYATNLAKRINPRLDRVGLTADHPKVQEALAKWNQAETYEQFDDVFDTLDDLIEDERLAKSNAAVESARKEVEETRQRLNQENGTLDVGANSAGVGQSGNMSDQATFEAYGRGEIPWSKRVADAGKNLGYLP
jgi:hypothetical protein